MLDVAIAGAGIAGLSCARRLAEHPHIRSIALFEAADRVGGRIRTQYDAAGRPLYETGAWRIPNGHEHVLQLCRELGLELQRVPSEGRSALKGWLGPVGPEAAHPSAPCAATLANWDVVAAADGVAAAELAEARTGYAGIQQQAYMADAYGVDTAVNDGCTFYVPVRGLSSICEALRAALARSPKVTFHMQARVTDVRAVGEGYVVEAQQRRDRAFAPLTRPADFVVLALPPWQLQRLPGLRAALQPILAAVEALPLLKVFSEAGRAVEAALGLPGQAQGFHLKADTLAQQLISNTYATAVPLVQLAYSGGRRAEALEHLRLCGGLLPTLVRELLPLARPGAAAELERAALAAPAHVHYWKHAVHLWRPSFALDVPRKSREACLLPHLAFPNVFLCGEALSTVQGWSEGALITAHQVAHAVERAASYRAAYDEWPLPAAVPRMRGLFRAGGAPRHVVYDRRLVDVGAWMRVHPGSTAAIENHLGEDITELFQAVLHPEYALGIMFALQFAWAP